MKVSDELHAPVALPAIYIGQEAGWAQDLSESGGEDRNSVLRPCREPNPGRPAHSSVTVLIELQGFPKIIPVLLT
jgi:hypothetical protein